ncbi:MAG TPA: YebC/PmpR family DNA-binding transcriptional regulator [Candidatus Paceibacterota bacterium]|nr:YebC/PmpR family DNA-binding transcriptional regulator [Candidatus Paceibacterota bacterium]HOK97335.1 YebC/PmpR family DNA-binding transcriptional regulator [Candidatus Paceibacterota bacterium]HPP64771.1 YebC/PmpR family DNA-binding transcriptional regulator [Candidatus Paceibacterota bacterium]
MSGHSKWAKVKYQKAQKDPKKGQAFSKITNLITVAARKGTDAESNPKLRIAIEKAKELGMPKENIEKAIKRGAGDSLEGKNVEEILVEAYGPQGVALLIQAVTDNKNRTLAELRHLLNENSAKLTEGGTVKYLFKEMGKILIDKNLWNDDFALSSIENGAQEIKEEDEKIAIYTDLSKFNDLKKFLENKLNLKDFKTEIEFVPDNFIEIKDKKIIEELDNLFSALANYPDVEEVYSNVNY